MQKPKRGLQNEKFQQKLRKDGSSSLQKSNAYGVRIAKKQVIKGKPINPTVLENKTSIGNINWDNVDSAEYDKLYGYISEQEMDGGIVGGQLIRPKYDSTELEKSIDTRIFELIPNAPAPLPATVLRSIYEDALSRIEDLTKEVQRLNVEVSERDSLIAELESIAEALRIEADNERLKANIANEQRDIANQQISETTIDLQNAIQNSINEAIQRVSLTARVEALLQENESLREQLFGLSAQTAEGAKSGANNGFTVKVNNLDPTDNGITADFKAKTSHNEGSKRDLKNTIEVSNVTTDNKITNIAFTFEGDGIKWFKVKSGATQIEPETTETYQTEFDSEVIGGVKPKKKKKLGVRYWSGKARNFRDLSLKVSVTFADGTKDEVVLTTDLRKNRKG